MLSKEDNALITQVGPNTPMGDAMRRFWMPALLSAELPDSSGDPLHVELLGENFVAFRDGNGRVGLLEEQCCHRGASLTVGRVEDCGIRCLYHGWLFGADGTVLETPNVADPRFKERFRARAFPVREAGGMIWTYLGDQSQQPPFPDFAFNEAPENLRMNALAFVGANYVQIIEGLLDSSHLTVLHSSTLKKMSQSGDNSSFAKATTHMQFDAAPNIESELTDFGLHYAAIRMIDGKAQTRIASFLSPVWIYNPNGDLFMAMVPINSEMTALFHVWYDGRSLFGEEPLKTRQRNLTGLEDETLLAFGMTRGTCRGPNRMRAQNGWGRDMVAVKNGHFTGLPPITHEDALVTMSSGEIRDRSKERLAPADAPIVHLYRVLLESAKAAADKRDPVFVGQSVAHVAGVNATVSPGVNWRSLVPQHLALRAAVS
jgi:phthalate 4,5-dioxygenase